MSRQFFSKIWLKWHVTNQYCRSLTFRTFDITRTPFSPKCRPHRFIIGAFVWTILIWGFWSFIRSFIIGGTWVISYYVIWINVWICCWSNCWIAWLGWKMRIVSCTFSELNIKWVVSAKKSWLWIWYKNKLTSKNDC